LSRGIACLLKIGLPREKASPKPLSQAIYAIFYCLVNILRWFDPVSFHGDLRFKRSTSAGEKNHLLLFRASVEWLKHGKVNGTSEGELKVGY